MRTFLVSPGTVPYLLADAHGEHGLQPRHGGTPSLSIGERGNQPLDRNPPTPPPFGEREQAEFAARAVTRSHQISPMRPDGCCRFSATPTTRFAPWPAWSDVPFRSHR